MIYLAGRKQGFRLGTADQGPLGATYDERLACAASGIGMGLYAV